MSRLIASLVSCVGLFAMLTQQVITRGPLTDLDHPVERLAVTHRSVLMTDLMRLLSHIGSTVFLLPLVLLAVAYFVFRNRDWKPPSVLAAAFITSILLQNLVKRLVGRERPPLATMIGRYASGSFPSGHTTQSLVVYGLIALLLVRTHPSWPRVPILSAALLLALSIGVSRIYLGAHWLTDVAGGLLLGSLWLLALHALFPFLLPHKVEPDPRSEQAKPR